MASATGSPGADACRLWHDLPAYVVDCPMPDFIGARRVWAFNVAAGREIAACAYTYLLRQLKYDDTDKDRIVASLVGASAMMATT